MCEKRIRRNKKSSNITRLREERRLQRLRSLTITTPFRPTEAIRPPSTAGGPIFMNKALQNRVLRELAWKTVMLMQKNKIIQQKIVDLQKETTEYVAKALSDPEHRQRYLDHIQIHSNLTQPENSELTLKIEPEE